MDKKSLDDMNDAQFLRHIAHTAEIGDPIEEREIERIRTIADAKAEEIEAMKGRIG